MKETEGRQIVRGRREFAILDSDTDILCKSKVIKECDRSKVYTQIDISISHTIAVCSISVSQVESVAGLCLAARESCGNNKIGCSPDNEIAQNLY